MMPLPIAELRKLVFDPENPAGGTLAEASMRSAGVDVERRTIRAVLSTDEVARDGMVIAPEAWEKWLPVFRQNPVFVANHIYVTADGRAGSIGRWEPIEVTRRGLEGVANVLPDDELAESYLKRFAHGSLNMFSVRWVTHEVEVRPSVVDDVERRRPHILEAELLETSAVTVGSDRGALVQRCIETMAALRYRPGLSETGRGLLGRLEELLLPELGSLASRADAVDRMIRKTAGDAGRGAVTVEDVRAVVREELKRIASTEPGCLVDVIALEVVERILRIREGVNEDDLGREAGGDVPARSPFVVALAAVRDEMKQ